MNKPKKKTGLADIELHPDAWKRFEDGVRSLGKSPPQHRKAKPSRVKATSQKPSKAR